MEQKTRSAIMYTLLFIAGGIVGSVVTSYQFQGTVIAPSYSIGLLEAATDARQLSQGKTDHVLRRKVKALPMLTETYYQHHLKFMPDDNSRYRCLWAVEKYYRTSGDKIPQRIKPILDSIPEPPPSACEPNKPADPNTPASHPNDK